MTNKQLIEICKEHRISRWSGKRKKDLIALIKQHFVDNANLLEVIKEEPVPESTLAPAPTPAPEPVESALPTRPHTPEPYEMLDETLMYHANLARAFLPKSPVNEDAEFHSI
jgi:NH3-dependent NAD+ synthetase